VCADSALEQRLLALLLEADDHDGKNEATPAQTEALEQRHAQKWTQARLQHRKANKQFAQRRIQSLAASHEARRSLLEGYIANATNDKILRMRTGELARVEKKHAQQVQDLENGLDAGEIHASLLLSGILHLLS